MCINSNNRSNIYLAMNPDDISKKAHQQRQQQESEKNKKVKEPFNPLDWMDFKRTRKWMDKNLALHDRFYSYLAFLLMLMVFFGWIWWDNWDESKWEYFSFLSVTALFVFSCIFGFIYGYRKKHKKNL